MVNRLQVVGDPYLVIEWMQYGQQIHTINLHALSSQINDNTTHFQLNEPPDKSIKTEFTIGTRPSLARRDI